MSLAIRAVTADDIEPLASICFRAFAALHDHHHVPRDFETPEAALGLLKAFIPRPDIIGFAASIEGRTVGSNFITFADEVAGVGPITVDPECQSRGIGRRLMRAVLDEAASRGVSQVGLLQEALNTTSLSLYTSLGFDWRDSIAIMQPAPASRPDVVAPMTQRDLPEIAAFSTSHYGTSRGNEVRITLLAGLPAFVTRRNASLTGYLLPGFMGHGFAADVDTMVSLVSHAVAVTPPMFHRILVPMSQPTLFRELLSSGGRTLKVMSYMTTDPFVPPNAVWMPSILN